MYARLNCGSFEENYYMACKKYEGGKNNSRVKSNNYPTHSNNEEKQAINVTINIQITTSQHSIENKIDELRRLLLMQ